MGLIADAALAAGGQVTGHHGVVVRSRDGPWRPGPSRGGPNDALEKSLHGRTLQRLRHAARGLWYVRGFMEAVTWRQLAIHEKPSGILNVDGYFAGLAAFVAHAVEMGFIRPQSAAQIAVSDDPEDSARFDGS